MDNTDQQSRKAFAFFRQDHPVLHRGRLQADRLALRACLCGHLQTGSINRARFMPPFFGVLEQRYRCVGDELKAFQTRITRCFAGVGFMPISSPSARPLQRQLRSFPPLQRQRGPSAACAAAAPVTVSKWSFSLCPAALRQGGTHESGSPGVSPGVMRSLSARVCRKGFSGAAVSRRRRTWTRELSSSESTFGPGCLVSRLGFIRQVA